MKKASLVFVQYIAEGVSKSFTLAEVGTEVEATRLLEAARAVAAKDFTPNPQKIKPPGGRTRAGKPVRILKVEDKKMCPPGIVESEVVESGAMLSLLLGYNGYNAVVQALSKSEIGVATLRGVTFGYEEDCGATNSD